MRRVGLAVALGVAALLPGCRHAAHRPVASALGEVAASAFGADGGPGGVVLVAADGRILLRRAYGLADVELGVPMRPDHVLATGSLTKQFTAAAILRLASEGRLSLADPVSRWVPELETHGRAITIEQLLTHTSGLPNVVDRDDFASLARSPHALAELIALTRDLPFHFEPGAGFRYSDTGYHVLGAVIERASGESYREFLEETLFRPLGMNDSWVADDERIFPRRAKGYSRRDGALVRAGHLSMTVAHAAGAVLSTVDDLLRWDEALRAGRVVPPALLDRAWSARLLPDGTSTGYGFGWQLCTLGGRRTIEHGGFVNGFLASMIRLPDDGITVVVLQNDDSAAPDAGTLARRLARVALGGTPAPAYRALSAEERRALVGRYRISPGDVREILERDDALHVRRGDRPAQPLGALSPTELTLVETEEDFVLRFEREAGGRASAVRASLRCAPLDRGVRVDE